jgi:hypothetical protein
MVARVQIDAVADKTACFDVLPLAIHRGQLLRRCHLRYLLARND